MQTELELYRAKATDTIYYQLLNAGQHFIEMRMISKSKKAKKIARFFVTASSVILAAYTYNSTKTKSCISRKV
jgi:hypothetical protein